MRALPVLLAGAVVLLQIGYPLADDAVRSRLTVLTVLVFATTSLCHALISRGMRAAATLASVAVLGFVAELVGSHNAVPFGRYRYADTLGPHLGGVPLVIGLGWLMMAWPATLVARRLVGSTPARIVVGAWALAAWDLFLDPQMVDAGHWTWADPTPHLPGVPTVPLTNIAGWLLLSLVVAALLVPVSDPPPGADDRPMIGLYLWTYGSSVLALAVFLDLPWAALWGALGMGLIVAPLIQRLSRAPQ